MRVQLPTCTIVRSKALFRFQAKHCYCLRQPSRYGLAASQPRVPYTKDGTVTAGSREYEQPDCLTQIRAFHWSTKGILFAI